MPRIKLTARSVAAIKPPAKGQVDYFDESLPGFGVRVSYGGVKAWILMYRHGGIKRRLKLGTYPALSLADARSMAKDKLHLAARGSDPAGAKAAERRAETVADLAAEYLEHHAKPKKRSWQHDDRTLANDVLPSIGKMKAREVGKREINGVLRQVMNRSPVMANRTLEIVRKMFTWGVSQDIVETNPCIGIEAPHEEQSRDRVLTEEELRRFWIATGKETTRAGIILRLLLLTAQRKGEVLTMRWDDIEQGTEAWWTIRASITKNKLSHRVPVTEQVLRLLHEASGEGGQEGYVFPRRDGKGPVTASVLRKPLERILKAAEIENLWPHDLRRSAASFMTGIGIPRLTVSKLLNHSEVGVTSLYDRHSYDAEKRHALEAWASHLGELVTGSSAEKNVVSLLGRGEAG